MPNNNGPITFEVSIDAAHPLSSVVNVGLSSGPISYTIDSLTIDADDTLILGSGKAWPTQLEVLGGANINGRVTLQNGGKLLLGNNGMLSGSGTISGGFAGGVMSATTGSTLIGPDITVRNGVSIGLFDQPLINYGILRTDNGGITVNASFIENHGALICNGGNLTINSDFRLDTIGTLENTAGRVWIGGTLDNTGAVFRVDSAHGDWGLAGTLRGGTYESGDGRALVVRANTNSTLDGVIVNGLISLNTTSSLSIPAGQSLTGSGTVQLGMNTPPASISTLACPNDTLTVDSGMTIRGQGLVMGGTLSSPQPVVNRGHIVAEVPNGLLEVRGTSVLNVGSMETANGGILGLGGVFRLEDLGEIHNNNGKLRITGTLVNTDRTFSVTDSSWELGGTVRGGTIEVQNGLQFHVPEFANATLDDVYLRGAIQLGDHYPGTLDLSADSELRGSGTINMTSLFSKLLCDDGQSTLMIGSDFTINASGNSQIGSDDAPVVNHGTIRAVVQQFGTEVHAEQLYNYGTIEVTPGATLYLYAGIRLQDLGTLINNGTIELRGHLDNTGSVFQPGVTVPGFWRIQGGWITGGTVRSPVGGSLQIFGTFGAAHLEEVTLDGSFTTSRQVTVSGELKGNAQIRVGSGIIEGQPMLTLGSGITVLGTPTEVVSDSDEYGVGWQYTQLLTNHGTITAAPIDNQPRYMRIKAGEIDHLGTISSLAGSTCSISTDTLRNAGSIVLDSNARMRFRKNSALNWDMDVVVEDGGEFVVGVGSATGTGTVSQGFAGILEFEGPLDLSSLDDYLTIIPQAGFDPTRTYTIATYDATLLGEFDHVTNGFVADYSTPGQINIRFVPEPSFMGIFLAAIGLVTRRRYFKPFVGSAAI